MELFTEHNMRPEWMAHLSEEQKAETLAAFNRLKQRLERMDQETVLLEQDLEVFGSECEQFVDRDDLIEELKAKKEEAVLNLNRRSETIKQERDIFRSEFAFMGTRRFSRRNPHEPTSSPSLEQLWSNLPFELLQQVFARLPLHQIVQLRVLSKTWDHSVTGAIPGFAKVWDEVNPLKMFGIVLGEGHDYGDNVGLMAVRVYDCGSKRWHSFMHDSPFCEYTATMHAGDGGLVCIVTLAEDKQRHPLGIVVFNPLTRKWKELPELPHALRSVQPSMVQLVMDPETKSYKVVVVGPWKEREGGRAARVYSSVTAQWSDPGAFTDLIYGYRHNWYEGDGETFTYNDAEFQGPCVYDCASGKLFEIEEFDDRSSPWSDEEELGLGETSYVLVKDRAFVLHEEVFRYEHAGVVEDRQRYCISEYQPAQAQNGYQWCWVTVRVHRCSEFGDSASVVYRRVHLYGCNGILLVTAVTADKVDLAWLYYLSTGEWQAISAAPREGWSADGTMFELQWDAVP